MRKLLLTSVFTLGAIGAIQPVAAQQQPTTGTIGQRPGDAARGIVTQAPTPTVQISNPMQGQLIGRPGATPGANNNNNAVGTARSGASAVPTPGTLVIHFNSRITTQWYQGWNSLMNATSGNTRTSNQMSTWMRLYGGADGMAANGMRYGGAWEIRMNVTGASNTPTAANPNSAASTMSTTQTLYARRMFVYLGTNELGIIRLGQGDGLISLFDAGRSTMQTYSPTSHFNGSDLSSAISGNTAPPFAFLVGSGDEYNSNKIVYLSPNFSGFDFGLMYSPTAANGASFCGAATASTCSNITTSSTAMDGARYLDMVAAGVRYQGKIGPVDVFGYGVYTYAGHVKNSATAAASRTAISASSSSTWNGQHDNLSFGSMGGTLSYMGVTVGANFLTGAVNGRMAARPSGGAPTNAWLVGAQYQIPGMPLIIGTAFATIDSQGAVQMTTVSQRREYEFNVGGSYTIAPGMVLFADYIYQNRKQSGFNFLSLAANTGNADTNSQVQGQGIVAGVQMTW